MESKDLIKESLVSDAPRYALIDLWTVNPPSLATSPLPNVPPRPQNHQKELAVIGDQTLPQLQVTPEGLARFLVLSTNILLKEKRKIL